MSSKRAVLLRLFKLCIRSVSSEAMAFKRDTTVCSNGRKHTPLPTGPFEAIACKDVLTDSLLLRIYYPTSNTRQQLIESQDKWPKLIPHEQYAYGYSRVMGFKNKMVLKASSWQMANYLIPCLWNFEPLKVEEKKWPVIVLSHGWGGCRTTYSALCLELASHGFIVAAIEHRDSSACAAFSANVEMLCKPFVVNSESISYETDDGHKSVKCEKIQWILHEPFKKHENMYDFFHQKVKRRAEECVLALDILEKLNTGIESSGDQQTDVAGFKNMLDFDHLTLMGHSFGGTTTLLALAKDSRFKVGVCLDGWMYPIKDQSIEFKQPVIFINTEDFQTVQNIEKMKEIVYIKSSIDENKNNSSGEMKGVTTDNSNQHREVYSLIGTSHTQQSDTPFMLNWLSARFIYSHSKQSHFVAHDLTASLALDFICKQFNLKYDNRFTHLYNDENVVKGFPTQIKPKMSTFVKLLRFFY